jgi:hypothetical protein
MAAAAVVQLAHGHVLGWIAEYLRCTDPHRLSHWPTTTTASTGPTHPPLAHLEALALQGHWQEAQAVVEALLQGSDHLQRARAAALAIRQQRLVELLQLRPTGALLDLVTCGGTKPSLLEQLVTAATTALLTDLIAWANVGPDDTASAESLLAWLQRTAVESAAQPLATSRLDTYHRLLALLREPLQLGPQEALPLPHPHPEATRLARLLAAGLRACGGDPGQLDATASVVVHMEAPEEPAGAPEAQPPPLAPDTLPPQQPTALEDRFSTRDPRKEWSQPLEWAIPLVPWLMCVCVWGSQCRRSLVAGWWLSWRTHKLFGRWRSTRTPKSWRWAATRPSCGFVPPKAWTARGSRTSWLCWTSTSNTTGTRRRWAVCSPLQTWAFIGAMA